MNKIKVSPWWVVFAAIVILGYSVGVRQALGLLVPEISRDLEASLSSLSFGFAVQNLLWGALSPIAGMLAERYGTVKVLLAGALIYGGGLIVAALAQSATLFFMGNAVLVGIGVGATTFPIVLGAVGKRFPVQRRTLALGVASAGGSLGQFIYAMLVSHFSPEMNWSTLFFLFSTTTLVVISLTWMLKDQGEKVPPSTTSVTKIFDWSAIGEAFKVREYQLLNIGFFVCGFHIAFITVHMSGFIAYCGLLPNIASDSLALIGLTNIVGVIFFGWAGDRWHKPWLLILIYWVRACLIILLLLMPKTDQLFYIFAALMGMLWLSTVPLTSGAVAQIFGTKNLASLFGVVMFSHQIGAFFGSWWAGLTFEWYGNYDLALIVSAALGVLAAAVHLPITPARLARFAQAA